MSIADPTYDVPWYRIPLPPGRLEALNRRSDVRGLLQAGGHLALIVATGVATVWVATAFAWYWALPVLYLHGLVAGFAINAVHEMVHGTVFRSRWLNAVFVHTFAFLGWINHRAFWASHAEHHKYTLHDPHDREVVVPIRYRLKGFLKEAVCNPKSLWHHIRGTVRMARGRIDGKWQRDVLGDPGKRASVVSWARWMLAGHLAIAVVCFSLAWWWPLLAWVPVLVSATPAYGRGLHWLLNQTQHVGLAGHVRDFRLNCRTIEVNAVFRFLYWHMNYHIEHHMYAAVPCYRLRALHREIADHLPPITRGLVPTWLEIAAIIWRQEREPGWVYRPPLPEDEQALEQDGVEATEDATVTVGDPEARPDLVVDDGGVPFKLWQCTICGFVYDEAKGLPEEGIAPGTRWADIPEDWRCPDCGVAKADFEMVERPRTGAADQVAESPGDLVIVGSGLAGYGLAREYRALGGTQRIVLVTRDGGESYPKPKLSNALAAGQTPDALVGKSAAAMAAELGIEVRSRVAVTGIDRERKMIVTDAGELRYGELVLACGAEPIRVAIAGDGAELVFSVNDLDDYRRFRAALPASGRVAIIGAGLIGCEFADDLLAAGYRVHLVDPAEQPLSALLPAELAAGLRGALAERGADWRLGTSVTRVDRNGASLSVTLADGASIEADVVLSAVGMRPRTALAAAAGLAVERGIVTDRELRTSDPAIFALGDCAEVAGRVHPFILPLIAGARSLAATLAGRPTAVDDQVYPVTVKTPSHPLVIARPVGEAGEWVVEDAEHARWLDADGRMRGFALAGPATAEARTWRQRLTGGEPVSLS